MSSPARLWVPTSEADKKADPTKPIWTLSNVTSYSPDGATALVTTNGNAHTVNLASCHTFDPSHDVDYDDAGKMGDLHEAPLLKLLGKRHARDAIYTWSGEILLSVNPYRSIPGMYEATRVRGALRRQSIEHYEAAGGQLSGEVVRNHAEDEGPLPPHIFSVADIAYKQVQATERQVLVVNGESGAGKTEACRQLMRYIAFASTEAKRGRSRGASAAPSLEGSAAVAEADAAPSAEGEVPEFSEPRSPKVSISADTGASSGTLSVSQVEHYMLQASPVLEAFGNAKTIRNTNSSRFGKFTWLLFSPGATLQGSRIQTSLLEKARLTAQSPGERNFHIFYSLAAARGSETDGAALAPAKLYELLTGGGCTTVEGVDDAASFQETCAAMRALGFDDATLEAVWALLGALLALGNVAFADLPAAAAGDGGGGCAPTDEAQLARAAAMLGCTAPHLRAALVERTYEVTAQASKTTIRLSATDAADARDGLIKHVYELLFLWLVGRINARAAPAPKDKHGAVAAGATALSTPRGAGARRASFSSLFKGSSSGLLRRASKGDASRRPSRGEPAEPDAAPAAAVAAAHGGWDGPQLGLLDIYGFENLATNSLEQLCINFANEILQSQFNERIFVLERQMYAAEGIDIADVQWADNAGVIELLAGKPRGIFALLEEQGRLGERATSETFKAMLYSTHLDKADGGSEHFGKPRFGQDRFTVAHFAGQISYDPAGFLRKNVDELHTDLQMLLATRVDGLVRTMRAEVLGEAAGGGKSPRRGSVKGMDSLTTKFQGQMRQIMDVLRSAEPRYVRCIKPNAAQAPARYEEALVAQQLRYLGVMETVRIRRAGFPVRCPFAQVAADFFELALQRGVAVPSDPREACVQILSQHLDASQWRAGTTRLFLADGAMRTLVEKQAQLRGAKATALQAAVRKKAAVATTQGRRVAKREATEKAASTAVQAAVRRRSAKAEATKLAEEKAARLAREEEARRAAAAATRLETAARGRLARNELSRKVSAREEAATALQSASRARAARDERARRQQIVDEQRAATRMQAAARAKTAREERAARQRALNKANAVLTLQRFGRGYLTRKLWGRIIKATLAAQAAAKGLAMRERFQLALRLRKPYRKFLKPNEMVLLAGVVKRLDQGFLGLGLGVKGRHQLLFTSAPRLICLDQDATAIEWEMAWSLKLRVALGKDREFTVSDGTNKQRFVDVLGDGVRWKTELEGHNLGGTAGSAMFELGESEDHRPTTVLRHQGYLVKRSINDPKPHWQKRWVTLQGRTIYWFHGADKLKGQLELTQGTTVEDYAGQDVGGRTSKAKEEAIAAYPCSFVVQTPEHANVELPGLILQSEDDESRLEWKQAICEAIPGMAEAAMGKLDRSPILKTAELQGWLHKRKVHGASHSWQRRWCAFHQGTIYWFSGYYKIKGNLVLTPGTTLDAAYHVKHHSKPHQFSIATPEMQRGGVCLALQAIDEASYKRWTGAIGAALEALGPAGSGSGTPRGTPRGDKSFKLVGAQRVDAPDKTPRQLEEVVNSPRGEPPASPRSAGATTPRGSLLSRRA